MPNNSNLRMTMLQAQDSEWLKLVNDHSLNPFYSPLLLSEFAALLEAEAELFVLDIYGTMIIYPYLRHPIAIPGFQQFSDIIALEYGGPLVVDRAATKMDLRFYYTAFLEKFTEYQNSKRTICEFTRFFNLFPNNLYLLDPAAEYLKDVYYIDLNQSLAHIFSSFRPELRNSIRRAESFGLDYRVTDEPEDFQSFNKLYLAAMQRKNAEKRYQFPESFLNNLASLPISSPCVVEKNREIMHITIYLSGGDICFYYLCAMDMTKTEFRPSKFDIWKAIQLFKTQKYSYLVLGGGYNKGDGIEKFKSSFTKQTCRFFVRRHVFSPDIYAQLCQKWLFEHPGASNTSFFPMYRAS